MLAITYVPLDDLRPDPRNPKDHDLGLMHELFGQLGFVDPVIRDERSGQIVAGHGRVEALRQSRQAGEQPPEHVRDDWAVPVVTGWSSADDDQAGRALVALNRAVERGGWHDADLAVLLGSLAAEPAGLDATGFDVDDLVKLVGSTEPAAASDVSASTDPPLGTSRNRQHETPEDGTYYTLSYSVTAEQRETVEAAIHKARGRGAGSMVDALVAVCRAYL